MLRTVTSGTGVYPAASSSSRPHSPCPRGGAPGALLPAPTPLGDSRAASPRLREALATADVVAAEDTRRLRSLAAALGVTVHGRVVSHYDAVEVARLDGLTAAIDEGKTGVL